MPITLLIKSTGKQRKSRKINILKSQSQCVLILYSPLELELEVEQIVTQINDSCGKCNIIMCIINILKVDTRTVTQYKLQFFWPPSWNIIGNFFKKSCLVSNYRKFYADQFYCKYLDIKKSWANI